MPSKYATMFTPTEIEAYRQRRAAEKEAAEKEAQKAEDQRAAETAKRRREEREETLKTRWLASGGTELGWATEKARLIRDSIAAEVLNPPVEPDKPKVAAPFSRRHF